MKSKNIILLDHGSGGLETNKLIESIFLKRLSNPILERLEDSAQIDIYGKSLAFTTDSFVVNPIFFPGGDIGSLSIHGTINDLAMQGATPIALSLGIILEEGFSIGDLEKIASSIAQASKSVGCPIVTADTKVVEKGKADKIFINTSGIGILADGINLSSKNASPGDVIILSGFIGDHGAAILLSRNELPFDTKIKSDSAPLSELIKHLFDNLSAKERLQIKLLRDPTRGGLATVLNEISRASGVEIEIFEEKIPVRDEVKGVCELLGLDPLYLANEGKFVAVVGEEIASKVLSILKEHPLGKNSTQIGRVNKSRDGYQVILNTVIGGKRIVPMLSGEPLPRIC